MRIWYYYTHFICLLIHGRAERPQVVAHSGTAMVPFGKFLGHIDLLHASLRIVVGVHTSGALLFVHFADLRVL